MSNQLKNYINQWLKKFKRRKFNARFKDNIWAADLAEMETLSCKNENVNNNVKVFDT